MASAWLFCSSLIAAVSSDIAELLSTIPAISAILSLMCPILFSSPANCSTILRILSPTSVELITTSSMLAAASSAIVVPFCTAAIVVSINCVVFPTACEDSSASFLTCSATTANPFPASPALAASIAAFKANKFVSVAMSSIAPMIELIFSELPADFLYCILQFFHFSISCG